LTSRHKKLSPEYRARVEKALAEELKDE